MVNKLVQRVARRIFVRPTLSGPCLLCGLLFWSTALVAANNAASVNPFASSFTTLPPNYSGPRFQLSFAYPKNVPNPAPAMPWLDTLKGNPISKATAGAYVDALKTAVSADMQVLIANYPAWNAGARGWYDQPWMASVREPTHGMFVATSTDSRLYNDPALKVSNVCDFVAVYYNSTAAVTLGRFWGATAMSPAITNTLAAQFPEGSIIVKLAFTEASGTDWPVISESPSWSIYSTYIDPSTGNPTAGNTMFNVQLFQLDIIVKDSVAAPKTGWVFSTLVYDNRIQGDFWHRMVPLGAMWGNDPDVQSSATPGTQAPLNETWINPASPAYSTATLGWGGRLSGPNDQAVQGVGSYIDPATGASGTVPVANSSCMSCHSPAQWQFKSFLLPGHVAAQGYYMAAPNSPEWMRWFQDRSGTQAMDSGSSALDYDMMFAFQALPQWASATQASIENFQLFMRPSQMRLNKQTSKKLILHNYNGLPFRSDKSP